MPTSAPDPVLGESVCACVAPAGPGPPGLAELRSFLAESLARLPIPSIAQIHGWCVGGGLELALACDLRVADESSRFWFPEVERGILPSSGGTARAVCDLVEGLGGKIEALVFVVELEFLPGRKKLEGYDVRSLIKYQS